MKFVRLLTIGVLSTSLAPGAFATLLHGTISTSGVGTISASKISFSVPKPNPNPGAGHFDQSPAFVILGTADFSIFASGAPMYYVTGATSTAVNSSGKFTGRTKATLPLTGTGSPTLASPVLLEVISYNGMTLDIYLKQITSIVASGPAAKGSISALAYAVEVGNPSSKTDGTFSLTDAGIGGGEQTFSAVFFGPAPVPEPSSLALLGTGVLAAAGGLARKRIKA